ncbi:MAG TPA: homoserine kinase [Acidobacteriaceae bacterium]|nr:homoserine kinase [Acidobacteriaceae bacterium]
MSGLYLRLPATAANLGPGFDAVALALKLHLEVRAEAASSFRIEASGRNREICLALEDNLLIETYRTILSEQGQPVLPLHLRMRNEIPLGMGCGSSAAVRLAAVALASHFGGLAWDRDQILAEACLRENHPDNAAACWMGGFVVSALDQDEVKAVSITPPAAWCALLVLPAHPLATTASRGLLPESYGRAEVVANLQRVGLLTAAFAAGRGDLLLVAMQDRLHQPYRSEACPLLGQLLPLAGRSGILGVALSGAGPGVILLVAARMVAEAQDAIARVMEGCKPAEILLCELETRPSTCEMVHSPPFAGG